MDSGYPLRGRDAELQHLVRGLDAAESGRGTTMVVTGDPGIGKSRLVAELMAEARRRTHRVFAGAVAEMERERPFGVFIDAFGLDHDGADFAELAALTAGGPPTGAAASDAAGVRYLVIRTTIETIGRLTAADPVLLVLEDLHWADPASMALLAELVAATDGRGLTVVATRRRWPRRPELDRIEERADVTPVALVPLTDNDLVAIVTDVVGTEVSPVLLSRVREVGGNPLLTRLLAETAPHGEGLPETSVEAIVRRHLDFVSRATSDLLATASVFGARFALEDVARILETTSAELLPSIREAIESGILEDAGDRLAFRHDLVWHAFYDGLPGAARKSMHREIAHVMASEQVPLDRLVSHLVIGARQASTDDVRLLAGAARQVAPSDPATAAGLLRRAVDLCPPGEPLRSDLERHLITSLLWSGQFYRARSRAEQVLASGPDPALRGDVLRALGRILVYQGDVSGSLEQVGIGLDDDEIPSPQRARLLADASLRKLVCGDRAGAATAGTEALELATEVGDRPAACVARCALSRVASFDGDVMAAIELAAAAKATEENDATEAIELLQPPLYAGLALVETDDLELANDEFAAGLTRAEELGAIWIVPLFHVGLAMTAFLQGEWGTAQAEAEACIDTARSSNTRVWVPWAHSVLASIAASRADAQLADHLHAIERQHRTSGRDQFGREWIAWALLRSRVAQNRTHEAVDRAWDEWRGTGDGTGCGHRRLFGVDLVRFGRGTLTEAQLHDICSSLERASDISHTRVDEAAARNARGLLTADPSLLLDAADGFDAAARPVLATRARDDAAHALAPVDRSAAVELGTRVADGYQELGAIWEQARVESLLRSLGVRRGARVKHSQAQLGWDAVTPAESRVVALLAEGLTNREIGERLFVSPRTVETHVSNLLRKLEASSRTELAARYVEIGPPTNP